MREHVLLRSLRCVQALSVRWTYVTFDLIRGSVIIWIRRFLSRSATRSARERGFSSHEGITQNRAPRMNGDRSGNGASQGQDDDYIDFFLNFFPSTQFSL